MRLKILLSFALVLCIVVPPASARIYRHGLRHVVGDCLLEAFRLGLVDLETVRDQASALKSEP
jgi:hypothetical protein